AVSSLRFQAANPKNVVVGRLSTNLPCSLFPCNERQVPKWVLLPTGHVVGHSAHDYGTFGPAAPRSRHLPHQSVRGSLGSLRIGLDQAVVEGENDRRGAVA